MKVDLYAGTVVMAVWLSKDLGETWARPPQLGGPERGVPSLDTCQPSGDATPALRWRRPRRSPLGRGGTALGSSAVADGRSPGMGHRRVPA